MTYDIYAVPQLPGSLRPNTTESEISFVVPVARRNHVINPSFEIDKIGESFPYGYTSGEYDYATNKMTNTNSVGAITSENVYNGYRSMRVLFTNTTDALVYGLAQPIVAPKSMLSNQFVDTNKVYYYTRGVLTFYTFVPAIDRYTPFSKFFQEGNSTHTINVNVYATVDPSTGLPNGTFNVQEIISSRSIDLKVPPATFFSEDIEPNLIGRRKNPEWVRHKIPFSIKYSDDIPTYIRFSINDAAYSSYGFIFYLDAVQVEFFDDDFQIETTYLDGDFGNNDVAPSIGYFWDGAPKKSTSYRTLEAHSGGVLYNFQTDFDMSVMNMQGLGLPPQNNQITPFTMGDGQQYTSTGIDSRKISIKGYIVGDTLLDTMRKTGQLQFFMSKARSGIGTKRRFYYHAPIGCNGYSDYTYFDAVVEQITVDHLHESPSTILSFDLNNLDVYFWGDNYAYDVPNVLNAESKLPTFPVILFKAQGGNPNTDYSTEINTNTVINRDSFFDYKTYRLHTNGYIRCWCELKSGQILFGGDFTKVIYTINGVPITINCSRLALLNPNGTIFPVRSYDLRNSPKNFNTYNGVSGPGATVYSIVQTNDESIMIGGRFNKVLNRTYDCKNIWFIPKLFLNGQVYGENRDVDGGLMAVNASADKKNPTAVRALLYDSRRDCIYVGGYFARSKNATGNGNQLRNAAIYQISATQKWSQMQYGIDGQVYTMAFNSNFSGVVVGGDFDAAYASSGVNVVTQTRNALVYTIDDGKSPTDRMRSLAMVNQKTTVADKTFLPATQSTFNFPVLTMVRDNSGSVIIGGNFTKIDYNDVTLPTPLINTMNYSKIALWDGFSRFSPMDNGVGTTNLFGITFKTSELSINSVCSSPYTDDVYAVGQFNKIGSVDYALCVARWTNNRWESMDFEAEIENPASVFVSKRGYGFISAKTATTKAGNKNKLVLPKPIIIDNVGLETQFCMEITNPASNYGVAQLLSIYNATTDKSMIFNIRVLRNETITIDFTNANVRATSNVRAFVKPSIVGGGTFANFYLAEGKNLLKIMGGQRARSANKSYSGRFVRPLQVKIRYQTKQISPYVLHESDTIKIEESMVAWELDKSKLGLDTILVADVQSENPSYAWSTKGLRLDIGRIGYDSSPLT
jgi:putative hemolysin